MNNQRGDLYPITISDLQVEVVDLMDDLDKSAGDDVLAAISRGKVVSQRLANEATAIARKRRALLDNAAARHVPQGSNETERKADKAQRFAEETDVVIRLEYHAALYESVAQQFRQLWRCAEILHEGERNG